MAEKRKTKTSTAVKRKSNLAKYDRVELIIPAGYKEIVRQYAISQGDNINHFIRTLIEREMKIDMDMKQNEHFTKKLLDKNSK